MAYARCRKASKEKEALERALMAARREAAANADLGNPEAYMADSGNSSSDEDGLSSAALHRIAAEVRPCLHLLVCRRVFVVTLARARDSW